NNQEQLLEAQKLAQLGSFEWYIEDNRSEISSEGQKILETLPGSGFSAFMNKVHPADRPRVKAALDEALNKTGSYDCEYRYLTGKLKIIWSRGFVIYENGTAVRMKGTVMDVTERHHMLQRLQRSE